jgi:quercetin dioxygenase-like cupin family protein
VAIHAIGGEQVMICHVVYEAGTRVARHAHPTAEQVMWIVEGDVTMTVGDETKTLGATSWWSTAGSSTSCIPKAG